MKSKALPWWETALTALKPMLMSRVRTKLAFDRSHDADLVSEVLEGVTRQIRARPTWFPASWLKPETPDREDRERLTRLALVILNRRVADLAREVRLRSRALEALPRDTSTAESAEHRHVLLELLRVCVEMLPELSAEDRDLVAVLAGAGPRAREALTPAERQKLRRLRHRFREAVRSRLGEDAAALLEG